MSHYKVAPTASRVLGISGYLGDTIMSKVIIGMGIQPNSQATWNATFILLISCGIVASLLLIPTGNKKPSV